MRESPVAVGPPRARRLCWAGALALGAAAIASWSVFSTRRQATPPKPARPLAVVVSGDTAGWIVPCGCTSNQAGGLSRRATYVNRARAEADVVLADVGGAPGGASEYERAKFLAILRGESAMGLNAHNLGAAEVALGLDFIRQAADETGVRFVSANVRDAAGARWTAPVRVVEASGRRVALTGVLSRQLAPQGSLVDDPRESLLAVLGEFKDRYDVLVVLAYLPADELEALATALPEADLVVGGPTRQSIAPRVAGPTVWAAVTNKGKFLADLRGPRGDFDRWGGSIVELGPDWADDPAQGINLDRYHTELAARDFPAERTGLVPALPATLPDDYQVAGTGECRRCHEKDCRLWAGTRHAEAWETLVERTANYDPFCQQCHTTSYGLPGGFASVAASSERTSVGCESCHGPSLAHARRPATKTLYAAAERCVACHDRENSPQFDYIAYWEPIEHGRPSSEP